ncbi:lipid A biosynthesis lauroyl acyltransferase [Mesorhizobium sp. RP14(2022)]|uniref:Lipid A biosynthesis lauroyl acyltransferase n=1 Tax=Mesorhizobium liriopis TaxID=2953882 RepID=A0ABT1C5K4_9HYPH|nr:lipid A biosynthesis lauroyl acyltransferase [Mesorhizobium liriopis]MCO6050112.1 lipid A biosynthesis lauroyl acyltransferase [Mesorhizobium liriopis]
MAQTKSGRPSAGRKLALKTGQRLEKTRHWLIGQAARAALVTLRRLPADKALAFADRTARRVGPLTGRHRVAVENLRLAYPEKSKPEIEEIARGMWGHMARLAAEYIFLDELFDFDANQPEKRGRIEVEGAETFLRIAAEQRPHIIFTAHLGNFEMLPVAAASLGLDVTALFRAPNNPYIADYVFSTRRVTMGDLLASRAGVSFALSRILDEGGNIGVLVDQRFRGGEETTFFGRRCQTNPLLAKLAKYHECDVYPARCIRLPGNRYRLQIEDRLDLPRTESGTVDVNATSQLLNDVVERWVREYPEQWMWFHKRWAIAKRPRRRKLS